MVSSLMRERGLLTMRRVDLFDIADGSLTKLAV